MYEIKRSDKLPDWANIEHRGRPRKYPFLDLNVGDVLVIPAQGRSLTVFRSYLSSVQKRDSMKLRVREREDGAFEVVRVE